jgi:hypothetical protein
VNSNKWSSMKSGIESAGANCMVDANIETSEGKHRKEFLLLVYNYVKSDT